MDASDNHDMMSFARWTLVISRTHSFPRQNLTNSVANLVNSAAHRGKADEIPTPLNFGGLIKS